MPDLWYSQWHLQKTLAPFYPGSMHNRFLLPENRPYSLSFESFLYPGYSLQNGPGGERE